MACKRLALARSRIPDLDGLIVQMPRRAADHRVTRRLTGPSRYGL